MSNSGDLLRMLEPTVRPVSAPIGQSSKSHNTPFESKSFDALLDEARAIEQTAVGSKPMADPTTQAQEVTKVSILSPLSDIDAIANASLRNLIQQAGAEAKPGMTNSNDQSEHQAVS